MRESSELTGRVLEAKRRIFGPEHPSTLNSMNNLGEAQAVLGNWSAAPSTAYESAIEVPGAARGCVAVESRGRLYAFRCEAR